MTAAKIRVGTTYDYLQTYRNDLGDGPVDTEAQTPTDQDGVPFSESNPQYVRVVEVGTFAYRSGTLDAGSVTLTGSLRSLRIYANGSDATLNISGGDTITVRDGTGFDISPQSVATDLALNWVSGSMDYFAEVVA